VSSEKKPPTGRRFQKGQSGNPAGRKPGVAGTAKLRADIAAHIPEIIAKQVELAKAGDQQAARLLLERVLPALKPSEQPVALNLPAGSLTDQGKAVLASAASGDISPGQAAQLLTGLGTLAKLSELDELEARIRALEAAHGSKP